MKRHLLIAFKKGTPVSTETGTYADLKAKVKAAQASGRHHDYDELHLVESNHTWINKAEAISQPRAVVTGLPAAEVPEVPEVIDGNPAADEEPVTPKKKKR